MAQKFIRRPLQVIVFCIIFVAFFAAKGHAGIGGPPSIATILGISVQNGGTAILTATATSASTIKSFTWLFDDQPISTSDPNVNVLTVSVPLVGTVSTLTIKNMSPSRAGNYSVKVVNGVGSVTSDPATVIVLATTVSNVLNIVTSGVGMTSDGFKLQLSGPTDSTYIIEASSDMKNWIPISTNSAPDGNVSFTDASAKTNAFRFYRAVVQ